MTPEETEQLTVPIPPCTTTLLRASLRVFALPAAASAIKPHTTATTTSALAHVLRDMAFPRTAHEYAGA
jgi:hypothetical protein